MRWRHFECGDEPWEDALAVVVTQPWDSPLAKSVRPDDWYWYGPEFPILVETRDLLRIIATKQPLPKGLDKSRIPKLTLPPWAVDRTKTKFAPEPVPMDEIDAHLARLNGNRGKITT